MKGLRDDRGVVAVDERGHAGADRQARDRLTDRAEPDPCVPGLAFRPPGSEVIRAADAVEARLGRGLRLGEQLGRREHLV